MGISIEQLRELCDPKLTEQRAEVTQEIHFAQSQLLIEQLRTQLDDALTLLALEAQQESDMYWSVHNAMRAESKQQEQVRIGTRVRIHGNVSLVAEWYRNRFVNQPNQDRMTVYSTYIPKGKGFSYSLSHFKDEPEWAQVLIARVESRYAKIRKRANVLTKIRRAVNEYQQLLLKDFADKS
ncbi:MAG: conjugative transfer protein MobI(A/C) [Shewanella sp.]